MAILKMKDCSKCGGTIMADRYGNWEFCSRCQKPSKKSFSSMAPAELVRVEAMKAGRKSFSSLPPEKMARILELNRLAEKAEATEQWGAFKLFREMAEKLEKE